MTHLPERKRDGAGGASNMKWRKIKYILFHRSVLAGLALVAQVAVLFVMVNEFTAHFDYFYWFCIFVSFLATVWIVSDRAGL